MYGPARVGQLDRQWNAAAVALQRQREIVKIVVDVAFVLPARFVELLSEIAFLVEQTDRHQRNAQIAGGLQVIAGQESEAARKDGQTFGQPKFRRKIGDKWSRRGRAPPWPVSDRR